MSAPSLIGSLLIALLFVALYSAQTATAHDEHEHEHEEEECKFVVDYSTVEAALRTSILKADHAGATKVLMSHEMFSLGAGLKYKDNQTCFVVQTEKRKRDPDIVAYQALALNAEKGGNTERLARSIVLSFENDCECSFYTAKEQEELVKEFKKILDDKWQRREILAFGHDEEKKTYRGYGGYEQYEEHDPEYSSSTVIYRVYGGRRLMGSATSPAGSFRRRLTATEVSPTDSFVCAYCEPRRQCNHLHWCRDRN